MQAALGALIVIAAVVLLVRRVDVRLVLFGAGLLMALIAGRPLAVLDTFGRAMVAGVVAPICIAMGFAAVLTATGCDRHLVAALLVPLRRARPLSLPGGILAAYIVNLAVPSQTSTAAALGPFLVPLWIASGIPPLVAAAALVLGASFGGDLQHPAAQDVLAISGTTAVPADQISARLRPAGIFGVLIATAAFVVFYRKQRGEATGEMQELPRVHPLKAIVPLLPVVLLLLAYSGWPPMQWLLERPAGEEWKSVASGLPVIRAMLIGILVALIVSWRDLPGSVKPWFEGMGQAYGTIISLTIVAQCFGAGLAAVGLVDVILYLVSGSPWLSWLLALLFPFTLSVLSGSGSGPILTYAQAILVRIERPEEGAVLAAVACLAGAFGRTLSPVAAVVVYTAALCQVNPVQLVRTVAPPLLWGALVALLIATL